MFIEEKLFIYFWKSKLLFRHWNTNFIWKCIYIYKTFG